MKIFCVDVCDKENPIFYIKPETSQIRNNEAIFIPLFCNELRYEFAFAVKINRVTKSIGEKFASRCWNEFGVVTNFWAEDILSRLKSGNAPLELAYSFDRSLALPNDFLPIDILGSENNISVKAFINNNEVLQLDWSDIEDSISSVISYISSYVTLKIGDVIVIKNSNENSSKYSNSAVIGDKIELKLREEIILETIIK